MSRLHFHQATTVEILHFLPGVQTNALIRVILRTHTRADSIESRHGRKETTEGIACVAETTS